MQEELVSGFTNKFIDALEMYVDTNSRGECYVTYTHLPSGKFVQYNTRFKSKNDALQELYNDVHFAHIHDELDEMLDL